MTKAGAETAGRASEGGQRKAGEEKERDSRAVTSWERGATATLIGYANRASRPQLAPATRHGNGCDAGDARTRDPRRA